ncbi:MAG TPA: DUF3089 domain-containing protein [Chitinophagales bacterium]|nr:DUF3089 domain-containing protein [Chitinophagales bacterium]
MKNILFILLLIMTTSCSLPKEFIAADQPAIPEYNDSANWSALPFRKDAADDIPDQETWVSDSLKNVDVFYIYPTLYLRGRTWTADVKNKKLNKRIDKLPVRLQASAFNQAGRVYAPRYRQAHVDAYKKNTKLGKVALDFAYEDVKAAFDYYMENYNNGRPIIIASHSQGSNHAIQLLKDVFDHPEMKSKLVGAYIVGMAVDSNLYTHLKPCENPTATNCYVTWSSYKDGYELDTLKDRSDILVGNVCVNPISWKINEEKMTTDGGVLLNLSRKKSFTSTAQIHENYLWAKTNTVLFKRKKELHLMDYGMFWQDIRTNSAARVKEYLKN